MIHRLERNMKLYDIKQQTKSQMVLKNSNIYMQKHLWTETTYDSIQPIYLLETPTKHCA